jgi:enoyl-CoA hydratase/carnithine racemase
MPDTLSFELTDGIGHIELCSPPGNRMTGSFFSEFNEMVDELRMMKELKAIVISGKGRHFSSGADLEEMLEQSEAAGEFELPVMSEAWREASEKNFRSFQFFNEIEIPVIAAIRGVCLGSAFELALYCHFRFCGEDAVMGLPETTFNLMPGLGGTARIAGIAGRSKAIELVLKGSTFDAEEAKMNNLVDIIVPRRHVVEFSMAFARKVMADYRKQKSSLYLHKISQDDPFSN